MSLSLEIETPRLLLRQWRAADRQSFAELNADPQVTEFLVPLDAAQSDALADRLAAEIDEHGWGVWAVEAPGVAPFIGFVGIRPLSSALPFAPGIEIAWRLARPYWGRGYAAEAAQAALRVGFEQLRAPEIVAFTVVENRRSRAVMAKLGMREDPVPFRHPALAEDHPLSLHVLYRLRQQDWRAASDRDGDGDRYAPVAAA
ncbi:GNAT family N-acetyltransferase [Achromobacter sp. Marseille-Q0513]|uniref:GNAT family N-acetyltransferase n=1 Tax=Achromobacter sp. Marseille-Q0513 TaxID=2829161 RepID=UPI001BA03E95|nr:GNAT family N-acetyltransferase [Achromobacter sp. Marseille-Q0513]MBR8653406.1 GNAT family N-acetyltransferase [Achromobacter sp. Marseille-Q0513]